MQILTILWQPNSLWHDLDQAEKLKYLQSLDSYINAGRAAGAIVLGWSKVDRSLPNSPSEGFVGVFGLSDAAAVHEFEKIVVEADWYKYFDSTNISVGLSGATEPEPHKIYAGLLDVKT